MLRQIVSWNQSRRLDRPQRLFGLGGEESSLMEQILTSYTVLAVPGHALLWPFPVTD
jgi:hypothetical protein